MFYTYSASAGGLIQNNFIDSNPQRAAITNVSPAREYTLDRSVVPQIVDIVPLSTGLLSGHLIGIPQHVTLTGIAVPQN
jgi:hypothetical protein